MLVKIKNNYEKAGRPSSQTKTIKCIELKEEIEKEEESDS